MVKQEITHKRDKEFDSRLLLYNDIGIVKIPNFPEKETQKNNNFIGVPPHISIRHRQWQDGLYVTDIDSFAKYRPECTFGDYGFDDKGNVILYGFTENKYFPYMKKYSTSIENILDSPIINYLKSLGDKSNLPSFLNIYKKNPWQFMIIPLNNLADKHCIKVITLRNGINSQKLNFNTKLYGKKNFDILYLNEEQYVKEIHYLRKLPIIKKEIRLFLWNENIKYSKEFKNFLLNYSIYANGHFTRIENMNASMMDNNKIIQLNSYGLSIELKMNKEMTNVTFEINHEFIRNFKVIPDKNGSLYVYDKLDTEIPDFNIFTY